MVALTDSDGDVTTQYLYSPYGELLATDQLGLETAQAVPGHQGLFKVPLGDVSVYYNRNRMYHPELGRFMQRDVNETAMVILSAYASNGESIGILLGAIAPQGLYGDGMNLYGYLGGNPIIRIDVMGLDFGDDIDDLIAELMGHALYALGTINEGARWASIGLQTAADIAGSLLGIDVIQSLGELGSGRGGFWEVMDVVASAAPVFRFGRVLSKMKKFRFMASKGRAARGSAKLFRKFSKRWKGGARSVEYHWRKHAEPFGVSVEDYTDDAIDFWKANRHRKQPWSIENSSRTGFKIDGHPGGIFTADGMIVSFWYD